MRLRFGFGRLDGNHHGTERRGERWNHQTRRLTSAICKLGVDPNGRCVFARRLWLYGPRGGCVHFDVFVVRRDDR